MRARHSDRQTEQCPVPKRRFGQWEREVQVPISRQDVEPGVVVFSDAHEPSNEDAGRRSVTGISLYAALQNVEAREYSGANAGTDGCVTQRSVE
jgi:hypothetical protein